MKGLAREVWLVKGLAREVWLVKGLAREVIITTVMNTIKRTNILLINWILKL